MDLVKVSIQRPVTILSIIIMIVMFGLISLERIPYQLSPSVVEPEITVRTTWRGATPYEIEREIIEEQENTLKGLPNLVEMESTSRNGLGEITLRFKVGTSVDDVLLRVSNKMEQVKSYRFLELDFAPGANVIAGQALLQLPEQAVEFGRQRAYLARSELRDPLPTAA